VNGEPARVVILGAGPIGLEAAARALEDGHDVKVVESAQPGAHLDAWGHVQLFTPFGMNTGDAGVRALTTSGAVKTLPAADAMLRGREFRDAYLMPLAASIGERATLLMDATVIAVSRTTLLKNELPGRPERAADPFRVLYRGPGGEHELEADAVLDCTGTYGCHNWLGSGGAPARGEQELVAEIEYGIPDVLGADRARFAGRHTLLVGGGHSAATTAIALAELAERDAGTSFLWVSRQNATRPVIPVPNDPLPARAELTRRANAVAASPPPGSAWRPAAQVLTLSRRDTAPGANGGHSGGSIDVAIRFEQRGAGAAAIETLGFDRVVANIGYEPDDSLYRQLQVHECYASRGPMKLSAALLSATAESADCLTVGGFGPEVLENPEPNFFILGIKSFGKNPAFLLRTGYEQVRDAFTILKPTRRRAGPSPHRT